MVGAFLTLIRAFSLCLKISLYSVFLPLKILLRTLIASLTHFFKNRLPIECLYNNKFQIKPSGICLESG